MRNLLRRLLGVTEIEARLKAVEEDIAAAADFADEVRSNLVEIGSRTWPVEVREGTAAGGVMNITGKKIPVNYQGGGETGGCDRNSDR